MGMEAKSQLPQQCVIVLVVLVILLLPSSAHSAGWNSTDVAEALASILRTHGETIHRHFSTINNTRVGISVFNALPTGERLGFFIVDAVVPEEGTANPISDVWNLVASHTRSDVIIIPATEDETENWRIEVRLSPTNAVPNTRVASFRLNRREGGKIHFFLIRYPLLWHMRTHPNFSPASEFSPLKPNWVSF